MKLFDLHCDTITECLNKNQDLNHNNLQLSLDRAVNYSPWFQCFAAWMPDTCRGKEAMDLFDKIYAKLKQQISMNSDIIMQCRTKEDLCEAERQKKCGAIFTVEGGAALAGEFERISYLAQCGVNVLTLTWNSSCEIGDGAMVDNPHGLTEFGKKAVCELERCGIVIDVSHACEPLFYDVAEHTKKPFIATHSDSRKICNHKRNLTDEQFLIIKERGGLVGLNFFPEFLNESRKANLADILCHAEHFLSLGGEKVLAIGSDFDGADMPDGITGIESIEDLANYFLKHNYSQELVEDIFYKNAYRFFVSL